MREDERDKSLGERDTMGAGGGREPFAAGRTDVRREAEEAESIGKRETMKGWRSQEEWGGKRWLAGEKILGRYRVERELGQGGMGVVYACLDEVGGVQVAVKALPPEVARNAAEMEEVRENFRLVGGLRHPNIAGVRTLEKDARGECFLVMDLAQGESLRQWMRRRGSAGGRGGGVAPGEAMPVLRQVASALDYAHGERVVHRDVKPGNVLVDARGRANVLDFGLAAQIRASMNRVSRDFGGTSGTRPYMAPEQWEGRRQDAKTDQYALAAMAYEMLSGYLPFESDDFAVLKDAVLHGEIEDIPGVPPGAMAALRRGMAKTRAERFGSCGEFVQALEKGLDDCRKAEGGHGLPPPAGGDACGRWERAKKAEADAAWAKRMAALEGARREQVLREAQRQATGAGRGKEKAGGATGLAEEQVTGGQAGEKPEDSIWSWSEWVIGTVTLAGAALGFISVEDRWKGLFAGGITGVIAGYVAALFVVVLRYVARMLKDWVLKAISLVKRWGELP